MKAKALFIPVRNKIISSLPQTPNLNELCYETFKRFVATCQEYCFGPAHTRHGIIRKQCHAIDDEFSPAMHISELK